MSRVHTALVGACLCLAVASRGEAQELSSAKLFGVDAAAKARGNPTLAGTKKDVLILLPTVPLTFNALQKNDQGEWQMGSAMTVGVGATLMLGKATLESELTDIKPWVIAGAAFNSGLREDASNRVAPALSVSAFFGIASLALSASRELLDGATSFGMSMKADLITDLAPDAFMCLAGGCPRVTPPSDPADPEVGQAPR